jgi:hypothetical protein
LRFWDAGVLGLYDQLGMLRYAGTGEGECLAYAELFALPEGSFSLEPLVSAGFGPGGGGGRPAPPAPEPPLAPIRPDDDDAMPAAPQA